jgi:trigger factor
MTEIKTKVTELDGDKVKLEVEVPGEEVRAQVDHTIRHLAKDVKIPGFRAGKIPRQVLVSRFGKESILSQTLQEALPRWYDQAVTSARIKAIDQPELGEVEPLADQDQAYSFEATIEVQPRVILGKYTGLEVEKDITPVTDEEVDAPIERLRKRVAQLEPVDGRPSASGDFVVIDFEGSLDGEPLEGGAGKDYMLELGSGTFIPGFEDQIAGMEKGQSKKLKLTFPDDYQPEHLAGKEVEFEVTVSEVKERVLPEADDAFAAESSEFDTIAELRQDIRDRMTAARESAAENLFREKVLEQAAGVGEVEVPPVMIENRVREIKSEFLQALKDNGLTYEQYLEQVGVPEDEIEKNFQDQAARVVKEDMVLDAIAENEGLVVSDEEVEEEVRRKAASMKFDPEELIKRTRSAGREEFVRESLMRRKALDFMAEKAVPVLTKAEGTEDEDAKKLITP